MIPFGRPPARSARWWATDVLVMLVVVGLSLPESLHAHAVAPAVAVVVVLVSSMPIVLRRVWPLQVFAWIAVATAVSAAWSAHSATGLGVLVALYTVAASRPRRQALIAAGVLEAGLIVAAINAEGSNWWYALIFLSGMMLAALGLGLYTATRRAYLNELHDRAARLERERDQANELAVISERARITREMHDIVAHHLTVMVALSDGAAAAALSSPQRAAEVMRTVSATGRQALADTRRVLGGPVEDAAQGRHPVPDLDGLDGLVDRVRAAGLPVSYEVQGAAAQLASGAQLTVYRLVQEALTNTLKHGGAGARATVRLRYLPGEVRLDIEDDGAGASAPPPASIGRGLAGMRERVAAFGGHVQSGPRSPKGWRVSANLRLDETARA